MVRPGRYVISEVFAKAWLEEQFGYLIIEQWT